MKKTWIVVALLFMFLLPGCALDTSDAPTTSPAVESPAVISHTPEPTLATNADGSGESLMSPEDVVRYWFDCFKEKDADGMERVTTEKRHGVDHNFDYLLSLQLLSCELVSVENDASFAYFAEHGYENAFGKAIVYATFEIEYDDSGEDGGFGEGKTFNTWYFRLVREKEGDEWIIFDYGM